MSQCLLCEHKEDGYECASCKIDRLEAEVRKLDDLLRRTQVMLDNANFYLEVQGKVNKDLREAVAQIPRADSTLRKLWKGMTHG